ncbi:unnamed protein product [Dovyalis caffra]|uniref:Uncharacterized protein n=1 Tax=Dovyalis caffra TaxID=77055 RepID=A0AAV1R364_9ROSI|nr:unnamed protein product [Dovyalis caffra]
MALKLLRRKYHRHTMGQAEDICSDACRLDCKRRPEVLGGWKTIFLGGATFDDLAHLDEWYRVEQDIDRWRRASVTAWDEMKAILEERFLPSSNQQRIPENAYNQAATEEKDADSLDKQSQQLKFPNWHKNETEEQAFVDKTNLELLPKMKIQQETKEFQVDNDVEREREEKELSNQFIRKPKELCVTLDGAEPKEKHVEHNVNE